MNQPPQPSRLDSAKRRFADSHVGLVASVIVLVVVALATFGESISKLFTQTKQLVQVVAEAPEMSVTQFALSPSDCFFESAEESKALAAAPSSGLGEISLEVLRESKTHLFRLVNPFLRPNSTDASKRTYYSDPIETRQDLEAALQAFRAYQEVWQLQEALLDLGYISIPSAEASPMLQKPRKYLDNTETSAEFPNGLVDRRTAKAIRLFQKENALQETGQPDPTTRRLILARHPNAQSVSNQRDFVAGRWSSDAAAEEYSVDFDFRGCVARAFMGQLDSCVAREPELRARFDELSAIVRALRGKDREAQIRTEAKLRPVFDITVANDSNLIDVLTHIEVAFVKVGFEYGDGGDPTYARTLESLNRYQLDVTKLYEKQTYTRVFPKEALIPPIQVGPKGHARFQLQFIGHPDTTTTYAIHTRLVFEKARALDLPIVEFQL